MKKKKTSKKESISLINWNEWARVLKPRQSNISGKETIKYIKGYKKFSEELLLSHPFIKETLPKILLRDFYKKERK